MRKVLWLILCIIGVHMQAFSNPVVSLKTTQGEIQIKLNSEVAPLACENFIKLVEKGYYNGTIFHRVIKDFMIQGGDPSGIGVGGESIWGKYFDDELDKSPGFNKPGMLAMANKGPNTNGSQFFITTAKTPWLNSHHTIFGEVIKGLDVVEKISFTDTDQRDKPLKPQKIVKATILREN